MNKKQKCLAGKRNKLNQLIFGFFVEDDKKSETGTGTGTGDGRSGTMSRQSHNIGHDIIVPAPPFQFSDPCPKSMRHVRIGDLSSVDINWKMLTLARPTSKIDEDIFSK